MKKLDIGCGKDKLEGYTGVDLYEPTADVKDDIETLSKFKDNTIDEVRTYHTLEHLFERQIPLAIKSIHRVLKPYGKVDIEVPDFIWLCEDFVNQQEENRWGWKIQTMFGLQREDNNVGELHKTGFSVERLRKLLVDQGFEEVNVESVWSEKYNQRVIKATAVKKND